MESKCSSLTNRSSSVPYVALWIASIAGGWAVMPYLLYAQMIPEIDLSVCVAATVQFAIWFGVCCWLAYLVVPKTDLQPFAYPGRPLYCTLWGALVGVVLVALNALVFSESALVDIQPPLWTAALASIYGAVNEEVMLRLFLFSLLYYGLTKLVGRSKGSRIYLLWIVNVLVAVVFAVGHIPAAGALIELSTYEITRMLLLNAMAGLVFGWLYWSQGLWSAMIAHFTADIILHGFAPAVFG